MAAHQAPWSKGFSRQEYWSRLLGPPIGALTDPGIKPVQPLALALQIISLQLSRQPPGKPHILNVTAIKI